MLLINVRLVDLTIKDCSTGVDVIEKEVGKFPLRSKPLYNLVRSTDCEVE